MLLTAATLAAQSKDPQGNAVPECHALVHFKFDSNEIDPAYRDNAKAFSFLNKALGTMAKVDSVCVYAYSSPEGNRVYNEFLTIKRASALRRYLLKHSPDSSLISSENLKVYPIAENWTGLQEVINQSYRRHDKAAVLKILTNENISDDTRKWRLERLDEGYTWLYIKRLYMPTLKHARIYVYGTVYAPASPSIPDPIAAPAHEPSYPAMPQASTPKRQYPAVQPSPSSPAVQPVPQSGTVPVIPVEKVVIADKVEISPEVKAEQVTDLSKEVDVEKLPATHARPRTADLAGVELIVATDKIETADTVYITPADMAAQDITSSSADTSNQSITTIVKDSPADKDTLGFTDRTFLGLKTNLLLDAVTALNFAIEVPLSKRFSLEYFQTTPWWKGSGNKFCLQFLTFGGEARWWFLPRLKQESERLKQRDALVGHFLALYGWGGMGDIQFGKKVCFQFDFWSAGLTYGYSMPVSKYLNLEFSLSVGYANIPYQHYVPTDDFSLLVRDDKLAGTLHYIGPTKAEVSLVIPIRTVSGKKGGRR